MYVLPCDTGGNTLLCCKGLKAKAIENKGLNTTNENKNGISLKPIKHQHCGRFWHNPVVVYTVVVPVCNCCLAVPADQSYDEQHDGNEVTLVPHILNVNSHRLTPSHYPQKERLGEKEINLIDTQVKQ